MDLLPAPPMILRLPMVKGGTTCRRTVEDEFEDRLTQEAQAEGAHEYFAPHEVSKMPASFTYPGSWVKSVEIRCWSCTNYFDTQPCFIPKNYRMGSCGRVDADVYGCFCSFNCASRFILDHYPPSGSSAQDNWRMQNNLLLLHRLLTGFAVADITPAMPKTELAEFGGTLSREEFKAAIRGLAPKAVKPRADMPAIVMPGPSEWARYRVPAEPPAEPVVEPVVEAAEPPAEPATEDLDLDAMLEELDL